MTICKPVVLIDGVATEVAFEFKPRYLADYDLYAIPRKMPTANQSPSTVTTWVAWHVLKKEGIYKGTFVEFMDDLITYSEVGEQDQGEAPVTISLL